MPKYLLDTDVIIEWLRGDAAVVSWMEASDGRGDLLACTPVNVAEIYAGLRAREEFIIDDIFRILHCIELDEAMGRKAGRYRMQYAASHGLEVADALIAAAAHNSGMTLCTRNLKHYPMRDLKKLRV